MRIEFFAFLLDGLPTTSWSRTDVYTQAVQFYSCHGGEFPRTARVETSFDRDDAGEWNKGCCFSKNAGKVFERLFILSIALRDRRSPCALRAPPSASQRTESRLPYGGIIRFQDQSNERSSIRQRGDELRRNTRVGCVSRSHPERL